MEWKEAQERARKLGFDINMINGNRTWFNGIKTWDYTGQLFNIEVKPETNEFKFNYIYNMINVGTGWLGSFNDDVHFLAWQRRFMETIEKLK